MLWLLAPLWLPALAILGAFALVVVAMVGVYVVDQLIGIVRR